MKFHPVLLLLPAPLLLAACGSNAAYPSLQVRAAETPRVIAAPDAHAPIDLGAEQRADIARDLAAIRAASDAAQRQLQGIEASLQRALGVSGVASPSTPAWSNAQVQLSAYQDARAELAAADARLAALAPRLEGVAAADPAVVELQALQQQLRDSLARSAAQIAAANSRLRN